ncbi:MULTISPECIES: glycosyltransferase [Bacillus]|uniref:Glycosyltransferase family 4 protein n=5 Tax=Bacillus thuringiensis TaxID=1428 RepID=A0AAP4V500_BACTU|nr:MULTISPECIES: glycosyltransferase [Bacillus]ERI00522.1 Glycogen synthase [Bacillus thuringiensis T01-328]MEC3054937.1 glycosyltransferase [Bacillus cereus]AFV21121.1 putative teichuronic acid biosynthesis glycosyltransferase TuaC [Bacillus thuringiensis Bt407]AGG04106.1 glycosyl transferase, group 1 [Bacillus thuringiensis serovar thuringiensis str. IS5056]ARP60587.1 glycosyl transferase family 1 [Bacillus thuringiensis]
MRLLYIVEMNEDNKAGLFNATHDRIANNWDKVDANILSLKFYDGKLLSLVKKVLNKKVIKKGKSSFINKGINYKNLYIKRTIFNTFMEKVGFDFFLYLIFIIKHKNLFRNVDLVSAHWGHYQGSLACYLKQIFSIPYVLTLHGSDVHSAPYIYRAYKKQIIRNITRSDYNIFVSKELENIANDLCNLDENSGVIYNSVDISKFHPYLENKKKSVKLDLNLSGKVIGYVGNLVDVKGVESLPEICKHLKEIYKGHFTCVVIGDGELKNIIKDKFEEYEINHQLLGKKTQEEIPGLMNIMDVLVLPSKKEGLGNVLLEAQACGTPVVGSNIGGIPEAIIDLNSLVDRNENFEVNFAIQISNILNQKQEISNEELTERISERYNKGKLSEQEMEIFKKVLLKRESASI